jgi:anthranilate phosphoribosyltransferase
MQLIDKLINQETLTKAESSELLNNITNGEYNDSQIVVVVTALQMRSVTADELKGFRDALLDMATKINLKVDDCIDVCGTGGDGKNTFNISTITAFVLAAGGYKVVKHGNYGVSSFCGSSTMLEHLGYKFTANEKDLQKQLDETNICFLHAPLFHPCLRRVSTIRKDLGIRTFFNFLGPLVNPIQPNLQLTGVFNLKIARLYKDILTSERKAFSVVHSIDGYDEVSLTAPFKVFSETSEQLIYPEEISKIIVNENDLFGGDDIKQSEKIFRSIVSGKGNAIQNEVIKINTALGIKCFKPEISIKEAQQEAELILKSGKVAEVVENVIKISQI